MNIPPVSELMRSLEQIEFNSREGIQNFQRLSPNIYQDLQMGTTLYGVSEDYAYSDLPIPLHSHEFYELSYCKQAKDAYYLLNGKQYKLTKGDIILVNPGTVHRPVLSQDSEAPFVRILLMLNKESIRTLTTLFSMEDKLMATFYVFHTKGTNLDFLGDLFESILREFTLKRPAYDGVIFGNIITILSYIHRAGLEKGVQPESSAVLDYILTYIENHLQDSLQISELAQHYYVSESALVKLFKARLNITPHNYIVQRRLAQAKYLIGEGYPLGKACMEVGFRDYTAFFRAFKKEYGISPNQFKEMLRS